MREYVQLSLGRGNVGRYQVSEFAEMFQGKESVELSRVSEFVPQLLDKESVMMFLEEEFAKEFHILIKNVLPRPGKSVAGYQEEKFVKMYPTRSMFAMMKLAINLKPMLVLEPSKFPIL